MIIPVGQRIRIKRKPPKPYKIGDEGEILDGYTTIMGPLYIHGILQSEPRETVHMLIRMDRTGRDVATIYHQDWFDILPPEQSRLEVEGGMNG